MNTITLIGRITTTPELKSISSGHNVVNFTLAVKRNSGEETDFIKCEAWNKNATFLHNYIKKGALLGIEGFIKTSRYQDGNGSTVYNTFVYVSQISPLEPRQANSY